MSCCAHVILSLVLVFATSVAAAEPFQLGPIPTEGVLILRNGQAVAGTLTRAGDHFFVALPEGEIRLRADDVEMACRNLDEAYARKRAAMPLGDAHRHIELANWCLHHELFGPAAAELADAMRASPGHPMIPILRRRLEMAMQPKDETDRPEPEVGTGPSRDELDALMRRLPTGTVEAFAADVQPLLMNNCTTAGCHGPDSNHELRLLRVPRHRAGGRRLTQQNLFAVLKWVDRKTPEESKLLRVPIEPHGGMDRPIFTQRELEQVRQLANWVARLQTPDSRDEVPESVLRFAPPAVQNSAAADAQPPAMVPGAPTPEPSGDVPFSAWPEGNSPLPRGTGPAADSGVQRGARPDANPQVQRGAPAQGFVPADAFDPAIFNRQFLEPE